MSEGSTDVFKGGGNVVLCWGVARNCCISGDCFGGFLRARVWGVDRFERCQHVAGVSGVARLRTELPTACIQAEMGMIEWSGDGSVGR